MRFPGPGAAVKLAIGSTQPWRLYWSDLWRFRELFFFLAWRDVLVRYKQTALGVAWAVLRPALTMAVFTLVFGHLARLPSGGAPYPLLVFAAMLPWQFFATAFADAGNSLVNNTGMLSKVYFPRMVLPVSAALAGVVDFLIGIALLLVLMLACGVTPGIRLLAIVPYFALTLLAAVGAGLWISALNIQYRDFRFVVPFVVQMGFFLSPVGYDSAVVPDALYPLYALNPMVGVIEGFRWAILGDPYPIHGGSLLASACAVLLVLSTGIRYFRRTERIFADVA